MSVRQTAAPRAGIVLGAVVIASLAGLSTASAAVPGFPKLYESVRTATCTAQNGGCVLFFQSVPAGHTLLATNLTCFTATVGANPDNLGVYRLFETKVANVPVQKAVFPVPNVNADPGTNIAGYAFNEQIRLSFRSAFFPKVGFAVTGTFDVQMQCTLTGDLS